MGIISSLIQNDPGTAKLKPIDPAKAQQEATAANQANLPGAEALAGSVNTFNYEQLQKMLGQIIPGLSDINRTMSGNLLAGLRGEIPRDVQDSVLRHGAWELMQGGSNSVVPRDLLKTSYDIMNQATDSAMKWISNAAQLQMPHMFDLSQSMWSTDKFAEFQNTQSVQQFQRAQAARVQNANFSWGNRLGPLADAGFSSAMMAVGGLAGGGMGAMAGGLMGGGGGTGIGSMLGSALMPNG